MDELIKIVKMETMRTFLWVFISSAVAMAVYYLVW
jgi:hypothetical protein